LKAHPSKVTVHVPVYAMSGGTLLALAAGEIVMDSFSVIRGMVADMDRVLLKNLSERVCLCSARQKLASTPKKCTSSRAGRIVAWHPVLSTLRGLHEFAFAQATFLRRMTSSWTRKASQSQKTAPICSFE